jgi:hypothetical protein
MGRGVFRGDPSENPELYAHKGLHYNYFQNALMIKCIKIRLKFMRIKWHIICLIFHIRLFKLRHTALHLRPLPPLPKEPLANVL